MSDIATLALTVTAVGTTAYQAATFAVLTGAAITLPEVATVAVAAGVVALVASEVAAIPEKWAMEVFIRATDYVIPKILNNAAASETAGCGTMYPGGK